MTGDSSMAGLEPATGTGWRSGLSNLMRAGLGSWWRTSAWVVQSVIWTAVINGSLAVVVWGDGAEGTTGFTLYGIMTMFAAIAVVIVMQEEIVGEKRNGTAAWLLSKPVSRSAFIFAKIVPNAIGIIVTMIVIPSTVLYIQFLAAGHEVVLARYVLGALIATLNLMFYLTLTLMLGTLFESAGPVIGISLAFAFGQQLISGVPGLRSVLPWALLVPRGDSEVSVIGAVMAGQPVSSPWALVFTGAACLVFTVVAFQKFARTEL